MEEMMVVYKYQKGNMEPRIICSHMCKSYGEFIKMLEFCKKYEVSFYVRENNETISKEIKEELDLGWPIIDYYISFGSDECMQIIEVIIGYNER